MVGSDATENFPNFAPLDWPRKASARLICSFIKNVPVEVLHAPKAPCLMDEKQSNFG